MAKKYKINVVTFLLAQVPNWTFFGRGYDQHSKKLIRVKFLPRIKKVMCHSLLRVKALPNELEGEPSFEGDERNLEVGEQEYETHLDPDFKAKKAFLEELSALESTEKERLNLLLDPLIKGNKEKVREIQAFYRKLRKSRKDLGVKYLHKMDIELKKRTRQLDSALEAGSEEKEEKKYASPSFYLLSPEEAHRYITIMDNLLCCLLVKAEKACLTEILCFDKNKHFNFTKHIDFTPSNQRILVTMWPNCPTVGRHAYFAKIENKSTIF